MCYDAPYKKSISHKTVYIHICSCSTPHTCTRRMPVAIAISALPHLSCNTLAVKTLKKAHYKSSKIKAAIAKPTVLDSTKRKRHTQHKQSCQHKQSRQHKQFAFQSVAVNMDQLWDSISMLTTHSVQCSGVHPRRRKHTCGFGYDHASVLWQVWTGLLHQNVSTHRNQQWKTVDSQFGCSSQGDVD